MFNQFAFAWAFNNQTSQAHHGRCHVHTLWTIKEVTMAAHGDQTLTNLLWLQPLYAMMKTLTDFNHCKIILTVWIQVHPNSLLISNNCYQLDFRFGKVT